MLEQLFPEFNDKPKLDPTFKTKIENISQKDLENLAKENGRLAAQIAINQKYSELEDKRQKLAVQNQQVLNGYKEKVVSNKLKLAESLLNHQKNMTYAQIDVKTMDGDISGSKEVIPDNLIEF
jgi:stress response protein YsnF